MRIKFVEIQNFRKLKSCRIDLSDKETVFVGANNSGKTSAMEALSSFLRERKLCTTDFTLSNWLSINDIGKSWIDKNPETPDLSLSRWDAYLPSLDVWLQVDINEIHYVSHLIPTLDWVGDLLGIRLRFEPKSIEELYKDFIKSSTAAKNTTLEAKKNNNQIKLNLWPDSLRDFLDKRISHFIIRAYLLNPKECKEPTDGVAFPQALPKESIFLEGDPFKGLIKIDEINAQRNLPGTNNSDGHKAQRVAGNLTSQFKEYFLKHLNPSELPDPADVDALQAIDDAQSTFDKKLKESFRFALSELEELGYPGFSNPRITLSSKVQPMDSLNHDSAVQFDVIKNEDSSETPPSLRLPEGYNGLGYQNLISMVFKLIRFRDEWMQIGKASKINSEFEDDDAIEPLHIVLIEEPEAHLHAQVQQVFINKAYSVLRNHENLKNKKQLTTQLIVSTHSSHIAHEIDFTSLRYFRRRPAEKCGEVPIVTVVNLSNTFGGEDETTKFAIRYLKTTHCDLFFADAAILVEGPAERMLVPHFIRNNFKELSRNYISLLEIGGSHSHRLKPLLEDLGLISLIITDIDSVNPADHNKSVFPLKGKGYITGNNTLKQWIPKIASVDNLLEAGPEKKISTSSKIRVAYQTPINITVKNIDDETENKKEVFSYTFEDALALENIHLFRGLEGTGLLNKIVFAINADKTAEELCANMFEAIKEQNVKKAEFALDLLFIKKSDELNPPAYIKEGLSWLSAQLSIMDRDMLLKKCNEGNS